MNKNEKLILAAEKLYKIDKNKAGKAWYLYLSLNQIVDKFNFKALINSF